MMAVSRRRGSFVLLALGIAALCPGATAGAQQTSQSPDRPARDTSALQNQEAPPPAGAIAGRVVAADTGRPIKRGRVFARSAELPEGRGTLTDDSGAFELTELPAGRYTLTVSKPGFVSLSYGQRRPLQAGTPLQLGDRQELKGVDFRLPRGSVIAGQVLDESGDPMPGITIRVMRYQYLQGDRRLMPAGIGQTDDRGRYRVWGLMPGDYYVEAIARPQGGGRFGGPFGGGFAVRAFGGGGQVMQNDEQDQLAYAPTYYPGVSSVGDAKPIVAGLSQEILDVSFNLQLVKTSRVKGVVTNPDGTPTTAGNVSLATEGDAARGRLGANFGTRIDWDGSFELVNVPPGRYVLRARGDDTDEPQYAQQPLTLNGDDVGGLTVILAPGASLSGAVTLEPGDSPLPDPTQIRITAPATDDSGLGRQPSARVDQDGRFALDGIPAGAHLIRVAGSLRGWVLQSVTIDGRDVSDTPIELRSRQAIGNVAVVLTHNLTEIDGTVADTHGTPAPDFTVLAFSTDASVWRPLSRQIMTARPDQNGKYTMRGLPPGEYFVVTVDPAEQGEWFDPTYLDAHRAAAVRVTLGAGQVKTQDFRVNP